MMEESPSSGSDKQRIVITRDNVTVGQKITNFFLGDTEQQRALRNRQAMLQLVRNTWIKGVLEQSLHGAPMIELVMEEQVHAVERAWDVVVQMPSQPNRQLPHGTRIIDVFDEMSESLLILGGPGSGKTTTLLELARDTIARAEQDVTQPIPVVLNLVTWSERRQPIAEWIVEELRDKYLVAAKIARAWVNNSELLLLLDGLDEVPLDKRVACVQAINQFRLGFLPSIAVCSRVDEYRALTVRLNLVGAVLLRPLTEHQIDQFLDGPGAELLAVRRALQYDAALRELAQTPVMLSIMTLAYQGLSGKGLPDVGSVESVRQHLFAGYVEGMFTRRRAAHPYTPSQTVRWLSWLARKMTETAQTSFLVEQLQPSWLATDAERRIYHLEVRLVSGLISGLIFGLVGGLVGLCSGNSASSAIGALIGMLVGAGMGGTIGGLGDQRIRTIESLTWSWSEAGKGSLIGLKGGLELGLIGGCAGAIVGNLIFSPDNLIMLVLGLVVSIGTMGAVVGGVFLGLGDVEVKTTTSPNQGVWLTLRNSVFIALIAGLSLGAVSAPSFSLAFGLGSGLLLGLGSGLLVGLFFGLVLSGNSFIRHFVLRFVQYRRGYTPLNYCGFLDYAAELILLRKVGGRYIFVHRLLMEYFASLDDVAIAELTKPA